MNYYVYFFYILINVSTLLFSMDYVNGVVGYAARQINPTTYATDATNATWAETLATETHQKSLSELNTSIIKHSTKEHSYRTDISKRCSDKTAAIIHALVPISLAGNLSDQNPDTIETILRVNPWLVPDLHYLLALKALEGQKNVPLLPTPHPKINVLLHKTSQLPDEQKMLFITLLSDTMSATTKAKLFVDSLAKLSHEDLAKCMNIVKAKKEGLQSAATNCAIVVMSPEQQQLQ